MKLNRRTLAMLNIAVVLMTLVVLLVEHQWITTPKESSEEMHSKALQQSCYPEVLEYNEHKGFPQKEYVFAGQICNDQTQDPEGRNVPEALRYFDRQLRQWVVLWKSMVLLLGQDGPHLHFALVVDKDEEFDAALRLIRDWPAHYCNKISFSKHAMLYPEGTRHLKYLNRPCASSRFFFPRYFSSSADGPLLLSFDSDIIMMTPVQKLWQHYRNFNGSHIFGISSMNTGMVDRKPNWRKFPKLSHAGLNDGVNIGISLYNLTRWRNFFPDEEQYIAQINNWYSRYGEYFFFPTQDIFNVWISENPAHYYELPCEYNIRRTFMTRAMGMPTSVKDMHGEDGDPKTNNRKGRRRFLNACPEAVKNGAKALHGAGGHFVDDSGGFSDVFDEFEKFDMAGDTLYDLKARLESRFGPDRMGEFAGPARTLFLAQLFATIEDMNRSG